MNAREEIEIISSQCPDSRVNAMIDNPEEDSIDGN